MYPAVVYPETTTTNSTVDSPTCMYSAITFQYRHLMSKYLLRAWLKLLKVPLSDTWMMWALDIAAVSQAAITVKGQPFKSDGGKKTGT